MQRSAAHDNEDEHFSDAEASDEDIDVREKLVGTLGKSWEQKMEEGQIILMERTAALQDLSLAVSVFST